MARIDTEIRVTIKTLAQKGCSKAEIARLLQLPESNVRYHLRRTAEGAVDRRCLRSRKAATFSEAIDHWMSLQGEQPLNVAMLHAWLVAEHDYSGSLRSVQRYIGETYSRPPRRARRRIETPPGAQAQIDWAIFPRMIVAGTRTELSALHLTL